MTDQRTLDLVGHVLTLTERIENAANDFPTGTDGWRWWQDTAEELAEAATALARHANGDPCPHDTTSTYLRSQDDGPERFEEECADCGETVLSRTLAEIEATVPGFTATTTRVGETSLPTPPGPAPAALDDEGCPECDETAIDPSSGRCINCDYLVIPGGIR